MQYKDLVEFPAELLYRGKLARNNLTSLKGIPRKIKSLDVSFNFLTSLEYCPKEIKGELDISANPIGKFSHVKIVRGNLIASHCELTTLENMPKVYDCIWVNDNKKLTSLKGCPEIINNFVAADCSIDSLEHVPIMIHNTLDLSGNKITSLEGISSKIKYAHEINIIGNPISSGGLGFLLINNLKFVKYQRFIPGFSSAMEIINNYLTSKKGTICSAKEILQCKIELEQMNLEEYAKL